jgi:hypothetical protein
MTIDYRTNTGYDFNFYKKVAVSNTTFGTSTDGYYPDVALGFTSQGFLLMNESTSTVIEYSFNGNNVAGEMDPTQASKTLSFPDRGVSKIWLRVKSGSSGTANVSVHAWTE